MYKLLNKSWQEVVNSDEVVVRTSTSTKQIVVDGSDFDSYSKSSSVIVQYDYVTGNAIILVERIRVASPSEIPELKDIESELPKGFIAHINKNDDDDNETNGIFVDIVVERRDLYEVLSNSASRKS